MLSHTARSTNGHSSNQNITQLRLGIVSRAPRRAAARSRQAAPFTAIASALLSRTVAGLPGTGSQHPHPLTESNHHADPLSDRESSSLTGYGKISTGGPTCTLIMSRASEHEKYSCWQTCSLILSARAFSLLPHGRVAGLLGPCSQHQQPLIESEYYAAPISGQESSTSTGCGKNLGRRRHLQQ